MAELDFDSLNPYQSLAVVIEDSPQALVTALQAVKTPIKILGFVQIGTRSAAYVIGNHNFIKPKKGKK